MKKVLYFFPIKFNFPTDGIYTRIITVLEYLKSRGFKVDMVSFDNSAIEGTYLVDKGLVNAMHYVSISKKPYPGKCVGLRFIQWKLKNQYSKLFPKHIGRVLLPDLMTDELIHKVKELQVMYNYDTLLVTYTYWADIVMHLRAAGFIGRAIIDTTDFLTLQQYYTHRPKLSFKQVGEFFGKEIEQMSQYHDIWHISYDEYLLFSNFLTSSKHFYIPQFFEEKIPSNVACFKYDLLFIGSDNLYNVEGIEWFLKEVYPLLEKNLKIALAGNVCNKISFEAPNVFKLGFVEDAEALLRGSKFTLCPLKRGTGMKIKVIESLSYGIPVVSTRKGVDGFLNKQPSGGVLVIDSAVQMAAQIKKLSADSVYYDEQCKLARELFRGNFCIQKNFGLLDEIFIGAS
jgi:glycosyltransferase involved in cell wall biosynthesis